LAVLSAILLPKGLGDVATVRKEFEPTTILVKKAAEDQRLAIEA
jgi:hypothetical protein